MRYRPDEDPKKKKVIDRVYAQLAEAKAAPSELTPEEEEAQKEINDEAGLGPYVDQPDIQDQLTLGDTLMWEYTDPVMRERALKRYPTADLQEPVVLRVTPDVEDETLGYFSKVNRPIINPYRAPTLSVVLKNNTPSFAYTPDFSDTLSHELAHAVTSADESKEAQNLGVTSRKKSLVTPLSSFEDRVKGYQAEVTPKQMLDSAILPDRVEVSFPQNNFNLDEVTAYWLAAQRRTGVVPESDQEFDTMFRRLDRDTTFTPSTQVLRSLIDLAKQNPKVKNTLKQLSLTRA